MTKKATRPNGAIHAPILVAAPAKQVFHETLADVSDVSDVTYESYAESKQVFRETLADAAAPSQIIRSLCPDPDADPNSLAGMPQQELENHFHSSVKTVTHHVDAAKAEVQTTLLPILLELERRYHKQVGTQGKSGKLGWHQYLIFLGVNPATFRTWKSRAHLAQLQTLLVPPPPPPQKKHETKEPRKELETPEQILAGVNMELADAVLADPSVSPASKKIAQDMREVVEQGDVKVVTRPTTQPLSPDEQAALGWLTNSYFPSLIADKTSPLIARKNAAVILQLLEDRLISC